MKTPLKGIHHVTAMASDPATNRAFYSDVLGLRLVKTTVNYDDPSTYHLYYGNDRGEPGSIVTVTVHHAAPSVLAVIGRDFTVTERTAMRVEG